MDIQEVWDKLISTIKSYPGVNPSQLDAFFSRIQIQAVSPGFIMLTSCTAFVKEWVERHYMKDIQRALEDIYHVEFFVQIEVDTTAEEAEGTGANSTQQPTNPSSQQHVPNAPVPLEASSQPSTPTLLSNQQNTPAGTVENPSSLAVSGLVENTPTLIEPPLSPVSQITPVSPDQASVDQRASSGDPSARLLTFDSFVIGDSNRLAYAMATEVAERPGTSNLNPLFIYGRSGVGKTHLMCAIKNYIDEQYPNLNVLYIDSNELAERYTEAAREKSVDKSSFKNFDNFLKTLMCCLSMIFKTSKTLLAHLEFCSAFSMRISTKESNSYSAQIARQKILTWMNATPLVLIQGQRSISNQPIMKQNVASLKTSFNNINRMKTSTLNYLTRS